MTIVKEMVSEMARITGLRASACEQAFLDTCDDSGYHAKFCDPFLEYLRADDKGRAALGNMMHSRLTRIWRYIMRVLINREMDTAERWRRAMDVTTHPDLLDTLAELDDLQGYIVANPNTRFKTLLAFAPDYPEQFFRNPVLNLLFLEDPTILDLTPIRIIRRFARVPGCPRNIAKRFYSITSLDAFILIRDIESDCRPEDGDEGARAYYTECEILTAAAVALQHGYHADVATKEVLATLREFLNKPPVKPELQVIIDAQEDAEQHRIGVERAHAKLRALIHEIEEGQQRYG